MFLAESRERSSKDGMWCGSLVECESQRIEKLFVLSTTLAQLYSFLKYFGSRQFLRGLRMDLSGEVANIHMRTDAKNLVTTARTTHTPLNKSPHDIHVAKGSLFRKYLFMILLTLQLKIAWQIASRRLQPKRTTRSQLCRQENCLMLTFTLILEPIWSTRPSCQLGVKHFCTQGRRMSSS